MQASEGTALNEIRFWPAPRRPRRTPRAAGRHLRRARRRVTAGAASTATASLTTPAARTGEPLSGAPPFFAGIVAEPSGETFVDVVKIFNSATGAPAATVTVPAPQVLFALARLGDDRSFVAGSFDRDACVTHLWTFSIDAAGQPGPLTPPRRLVIEWTAQF
jgi:hypothetical protein